MIPKVTEMKMKHTAFVHRAGILLLCVLLSIATMATANASVTELNAPEVAEQGDEVSISGKTSPNEGIWIKSSFNLALSVSNGEYNREFRDIHFPKGDKVFSVTAENIEDIRTSISPVLWRKFDYPLEGPKNATNGTAQISISLPTTWNGIPLDITGKKDVTVYGKAAEKATSVNLQVTSEIKVTADSDGFFVITINTGGAPLGEIRITAGDKVKTVRIVAPGSISRDGGSASPETTPTPTTTPINTTPSPTPISTTSTPSSTPTPTPTPTMTPRMTATPLASPTPTPSPSSTPSPSPTPTPSSSPSPTPTTTPDFKFVLVITEILAVAYLLRKYRNKRVK